MRQSGSNRRKQLPAASFSTAVQSMELLLPT